MMGVLINRLLDASHVFGSSLYDVASQTGAFGGYRKGQTRLKGLMTNSRAGDQNCDELTLAVNAVLGNLTNGSTLVPDYKYWKAVDPGNGTLSPLAPGEIRIAGTDFSDRNKP